MFRWISLASRQWQLTNSSCLIRGGRLRSSTRDQIGLHRPVSCSASNFHDVANSMVSDTEERAVKPKLSPQSMFSEIYKTRSKLMEQFHKMMRTYEVHDGGHLPRDVCELIKSCASGLVLEDPSTKVATANELFSQLKLQGAPLDTSLFNILLKVYIANSHPISPSEFLAEMTASGVSPNKGTFSLLTEVYCQQGNLAGATNLIEHMKSLGLPVWEDVYANLITAHARSGDIAGAERMLEVMKENGHTPGFNSYTALLCAHAENGNLDGINKVYGEMRRKSMFPGVTTFIKVIDTLSRFNHSELIPDVLGMIRNKRWLIVDLRSLTCSLVMRGELEGSLKLLDCLKELNGLSTFLGRCFVRGMVKNGSDLQSILNVINEFSEDKHGDSVQVAWLYKDLLYSIYGGKLSTGEQRAKDISSVSKVMKEAEVEVRMHYIYPALAHYSQEGNIKGVVECISIFGYLTQVSYNFLQKTLKKAGLSIVEFCQAHPGNEGIITIMMKHLITHQHWNSATQLVSAAGANALSVGETLKCIHRTLSFHSPSIILEVAALYKALSRLEPCPKLAKSIELVAKSIALKSQHKDALTLLREVEDIEAIELPKDAYQVLLYGFNHPPQADEFYKMLKLLDEKQIKPAVRAQKEILKMAAILTSGELAVLSASVLEDDTCTPTDMSNYIQAIAQENFSTALSTYKRMRTLDHTPTYPAMEQLLVVSLMQNFHVAQELLRDATSFGYTVRLRVKNAFIEQYSRRGDINGAKAVVASMLTDGQTPTHKTYQKLMEGYAMRGDAEEICNLIKQQQLEVDRFMLSHLVMAYLNSNRFSKALEVLDEYPDTVPLLKTLTRLIKVSLNIGYSYEDMERVRRAMDQLHFTPSSQSEIIFNLCCEAGQLEGAWMEMQKGCFVLHDAKFLALCKKLVKKGESERVEEILNMLQKAGYHKVHKNGAVTLASAYGIVSNSASVDSLIQELRQSKREGVDMILDRLKSSLRATDNLEGDPQAEKSTTFNEDKVT